MSILTFIIINTGMLVKESYSGSVPVSWHDSPYFQTDSVSFSRLTGNTSYSGSLITNYNHSATGISQRPALTISNFDHQITGNLLMFNFVISTYSLTQLTIQIDLQ